MTQIQALVVEEPNHVAWITKELDVAASDEILVAPKAVGLCGTDLEIISGAIDPNYISYPIALGHEWCGIVLSDGPLRGALVAVEGIIPCWNCDACRSGETNLCETYQEIGFTRDGAAATQISVPRSLVHPLGESVTVEQGCLIEPCAVVYRALRRVHPGINEKVLVVGDGTIALLATHLLALFSPARIDMLGLRKAQNSLANLAGAAHFFTDPAEVEREYDLVIEAAGSAASVATAISKVRRGGSVLLLGLAGTGKQVSVEIDEVVNGDLTIFGSFSYSSLAYSQVVKLLNSSLIAPEFVITHRFGIAEWERAIETLRFANGARGKVILELDAQTPN